MEVIKPAEPGAYFNSLFWNSTLRLRFDTISEFDTLNFSTNLNFKKMQIRISDTHFSDTLISENVVAILLSGTIATSEEGLRIKDS